MIINDFSKDILKIIYKKQFVNQWINGKYKEKPLIIYGDNGSGKSILAEYILKDYTIIKIDIEFCRNRGDFNDFLDLSLNKKNIKMMFSNESIYKAIIIDDINYIQKSDKKLFKSIYDWIRMNQTVKSNHPIIFIGNKLDTKQLEDIYKKCFPIQLSFSINQMIDLTKKYLIDGYMIKEESIKGLIHNSNKNFHNIKTNLSFFYKKEVNEVIDIKQFETEGDVNRIMKKILLNEYNIESIYRYSQNDYTILGLNILENVNHLTNNYKIIDEIYYHQIIGDNSLTLIHQNNNWTLIEHLITYQILVPYLLLKDKINKKGLENMLYNKYISKSIIYTHNYNLIKVVSYDYQLLFYIYDLLRTKNVQGYIEEYKITKKIFVKFIKYYEWLYNCNLKKEMKSITF